MHTYYLAFRSPLEGHTPYASGLSLADAIQARDEAPDGLARALELLADVEADDPAVEALRAFAGPSVVESVDRARAGDPLALRRVRAILAIVAEIELSDHLDRAWKDPCS